MAARLSENPDRAVLLLEAGPDRPTDVGERDWMLKARVCDRRIEAYRRGRVVGGCGSVNDGGVLRAPAQDFARWAALGLPAWSWPEVLRSYRRLERDLAFGASPYHGDAGPLPVTRTAAVDFGAAAQGFVGALTDLGHAFVADMNSPEAAGVGPYPKNIVDGHLQSTVRTHLDGARRRANLRIVANLSVDKIVIRHGRAVGVASHGQFFGADQVVLAAGAPLSPTLLLRSGIGPAGELRSVGVEPIVDLPGVGRQLHDQPGVVLPALPRSGVLSPDEHRAEAIARLSLLPGHRGNHALYCCQFVGPPPGGGPSMLAVMIGDLACRSRGRVSLADADPATPPEVDLGFCGGAEPASSYPTTQTDGDVRREDLSRMRSGLRHAWDIVHTASYTAIAEKVLLDRSTIADDNVLDDFLLANTFSRLATAGGAVMGAGPEAVVDEHLEVRGVDGLRIADLSVAPIALRSTSAMEAMMIGEHAAALWGP